MIKVKKRTGKIVDFDESRIANAVQGALTDIGHPDAQMAQEIATEIHSGLIADGVESITIAGIQKRVETALMSRKQFDAARAYIEYRHRKDITRALKEKAEERNKNIMKLIRNDDDDIRKENSNKDTSLVSTRFSYMAEEANKEIASEILFDKDLIEAHKAGMIHIHDMGFAALPMHNCFMRTTRFVTTEGVKSFEDFIDGEEVTVLSKDGKWHKATVHNYGKQPMQKVLFKCLKSTKEVVCTPNHRWVLADGSVTTKLKEGMTLAQLPLYEISEPKTKKQCQTFALGFILGDGFDRGKFVEARLCGPKKKYADIFKKAGYHITYPDLDNGDARIRKALSRKQSFLDGRCWQYLDLEDKQYLFLGLYAADGRDTENEYSGRFITSADERIVKMICDISATAGYHVSSVKKETHDTPYKKEAVLYTIRFRRWQNSGGNYWSVSQISSFEDREAWCIEEPDTHSFILDGGMVTGNCDVWNLDDMLQNGTVMNGIAISKPKSLATAVTIATQIVISIAASQYGGQTFSISALAPFVRISYEKHMKEVKADAEGSGIIMTDDQVRFVAENRLRKEIKDAVQTLQYQLISCAVSNGQAPFVSVFMYLDEKPEYKKETAMLAEEILRQRYAGIPNKQGAPVSVAFPKLLFVLDEDNVPEDSEYHYLLKMAVKCSAKRMVPDYISAKKMKEYKEGNVFPCMGCRSFLSPWKDENGNYRFYGRFNQGVVTVNLVDAALSSGKDEARFWEIMKERTDLCYRALMTRHKLLLGTKSDVAPILWQHGALARLKPGEVIDPLLFGGYSTISLGYVGLYECTLYMTGHSHTSPEGKAFAMKVMKYLNDRCEEWRAATDIGFSVYGTPEETTTDKFAKCLKKRFGIVPGITDHDYVTNSYHVNPAEKIDAFSKLALEGEFQAYSLGGEISYVEVPNMEKNLDALESVVEFMYDNTVYAEVNTKSDYCQKCGYDGEMLIDPKRMEFYCPNCGNTDYATMNITRRVCGYLSTNFPTTHGRMADISARVLHLDAE